MQITLYHGSEYLIERPEFGKGAKHNDYGRGFYCTENMELAKEWACANGKDGYVNIYELSLHGLSVLNLNSEEYSILNWLAVLASNRTYWQRNSIAEEAKNFLQQHFHVDVNEYDIVKGYRADDSYFSFAQDFVSGTISLQQLEQAMYLGKLGEQWMLRSEAAFSAIQFLGAEKALSQEYTVKKMARDRKARQEYRKGRQRKATTSDVYMLDIMRMPELVVRYGGRL